MSKTKNLTFMALFTALIAIGAFIRIPVPVVPFTLQLLFTLLAGILLGGKNGSLCVLCYLLLGLLGLPVFAGGGGIFYILQPTFGYLVGFCASAYVTGRITNKVTMPGLQRLLAGNFLGLAVVYGFGMSYYWLICTFYIGSGISLRTLLLYGFLLAVPGDIFLCIIAAVLGRRLRMLLI